MIRCGIGNRGILSHRSITAMAVAVAVSSSLCGVVQQHYRTYAMATTTTTPSSPQLSESIRQSLPQLYDTPLKRIVDYTTDPITKSVTAHIDTDESTTLRSVVQDMMTSSSSSSLPPLPSVCFVIRRPG
jgi:DNA-binding transcriptional regulator YbjK